MNARTSPPAAAVTLWDLPMVSGNTIQSRRAGPTVGELEAIERRAYDEAFAAGREEGREAGLKLAQAVQDKLRAQLDDMAAVFDKLARPLDDLDAEVADQLGRLAMSIARQVIRRELRADPTQIIAVMRETVAQLPAAARQVRIHLHPDDAAVVREHLAAPGGDRAWSIAEDPMLTRGGCTVVTDTSRIDARIESRIASIASAMLGEQRAESREEEGRE
ncbi:flagellar assembly protein FliH [Povalibacter sp.]|uniref:flagellar assembly protein FliH n=1 Tax=Povalibacter sp. TaxID=1962978 RepID=UPI002F3FCCB1